MYPIIIIFIGIIAVLISRELEENKPLGYIKNPDTNPIVSGVNSAGVGYPHDAVCEVIGENIYMDCKLNATEGQDEHCICDNNIPLERYCRMNYCGVEEWTYQKYTTARNAEAR